MPIPEEHSNFILNRMHSGRFSTWPDVLRSCLGARDRVIILAASYWPRRALCRGRSWGLMRYQGVKTARFSNVVEKCGAPEAYLLLMDPSKDRTFQAAMKAQRVLTVVQEAVGTKTERGEVGYRPGRSRQFLVFPKSLRAFAGRSIVGIKYELLDSHELPRKERAPAPRPPKMPKPNTVAKVRSEKAEKPAPKKVVPFTSAPEEDDDEEIAELKKQVRHAMAMLEEGKAVAAFNLLKRIVV